MTNEDLKRFYDINSNFEKNVDFVRYDKDGNIIVGNNPTDESAINKSTAETLIKNVSTIKIRNTENNPEIFATLSNVQQVATKYIKDNYNREPEEFDGLFITFTDIDNDIIEYDFFNGFWQDTGRTGSTIKLYSEMGQNTDGAMTQKAVTDIIGDINIVLDEINGEVI